MPDFCIVFVSYEGKMLPKSEIPPDNSPDNYILLSVRRKVGKTDHSKQL